jgi:general stress protein 26
LELGSQEKKAQVSLFSFSFLDVEAEHAALEATIKLIIDKKNLQLIWNT